MPSAAHLINALGLTPLPVEGGYYRETYRSADTLGPGTVARFGRDKSACTAIYYLLTPDTFSAMHRLPTDEVFHWYLGGPVRQLHLGPDGEGREVVLGPDILAGQRPQVVVPRGVWQGSFLEPGNEFALLGTTMAPGFDFDDYEPGDRATLTAQYPRFADLIRRMTR